MTMKNNPALRRKATAAVLMFVAALLLILPSGCRSHRQVVIPTEVVQGTWTRMQAPLTLSLESPARASVSAIATMVRDSSVVVSLRMFGMEVAVVSLTTDTLLVLDKYHKLAIVQPVSEVLRDLPLSIADLQDIMTGRQGMELSGRLNAPIGDFTPVWTVTETLRTLAVKVADSERFRVEYTDPVSTPYGVLSGDVLLSGTHSGKEIAARLEWNYSRAKWNADVPLRSIALPANYRTATFRQLLSGFSQ